MDVHSIAYEADNPGPRHIEDPPRFRAGRVWSKYFTSHVFGEDPFGKDTMTCKKKERERERSRIVEMLHMVRILVVKE